MGKTGLSVPEFIVLFGLSAYAYNEEGVTDSLTTSSYNMICKVLPDVKRPSNRGS